MRLQSFNEKEISCQCAHFCSLMANPSTPQGGTVHPRPVAYPKMPELQQSWEQAVQKRLAPVLLLPACHPWEFQKPLCSRPAYTSRWPLRMGCGNSRDLGSGTLP